MRRSAVLRVALAAVALLAGVVPVVRAISGALPERPLPAAITDPVLARSDYLENCGGCHGIHGLSAPAQLPELRNRVGWFMCTPGARAYLVRLPNIAHSRISDNQQLADLLNFVVFGLGGDSVPPGTQPYTAAEVTRERQFALSAASLKKERARYVEEAIRMCRAPVAMRLLFPQAAADKIRR
ncbi:cytochrome C [Sphingobium algorifonticola]|uniref:Cytochrome C n=1 Tax=Sphingobium algorifonticola TaxID=2008318 RepID=A0A437J7B4_9SPHN|nr:cytochrome C [Sphingobium algorifonticola]RVT41052.1 cytochrome C [Sphingobium algorifonticola]